MSRLVLGALATTLVLVTAATATAGTIEVESGETVRCPAGTVSCTASIQADVESAHVAATTAKHRGKAKRKRARNHKLEVGGATVTIPPGAAAELVFKLNGTGARLLRAHNRLRVELTVTVSHGTDAAIVATHRITIEAPRKRHARKR